MGFVTKRGAKCPCYCDPDPKIYIKKVCVCVCVCVCACVRVCVRACVRVYLHVGEESERRVLGFEWLLSVVTCINI